MYNLLDILYEVTVKDIVDSIDKPSINYPVRLTKFNKRTKRLILTCGDYRVKVELPEYKVISRLKGTLKEKLKLALQKEDVKVDCSCPDFLYGGSKYNLGKLDGSIYKENRPPKTKDPNNDHFGCKHIKHTLEYIDSKL